MYANLVVVLIWDTAIEEIPETADTEDFILDFFGKGGSKMNPEALLGRISTVSLGSTGGEADLHGVDFNCQPHESAISSAPESVTDGDPWPGGGIAVIVALVLFFTWYCLISSQRKNSDESLPFTDTHSTETDGDGVNVDVHVRLEAALEVKKTAEKRTHSKKKDDDVSAPCRRYSDVKLPWLLRS